MQSFSKIRQHWCLMFFDCFFYQKFKMFNVNVVQSCWSFVQLSKITVVCKIVHKFASLWCKTALGEVGVSLPWWCTALVLLAPGYWSLFLNLTKLFIMEKWRGHFSIGQSWNFEFHKAKLLKFQSFNFDLWTRGHFSIINKFFKFKKRLQ